MRAVQRLASEVATASVAGLGGESHTRTHMSPRGVEPSTSKAKPRKVKKPEGMPKKPPTAYFLFNDEERPNVSKNNPDMKAQDIMRELASQWKSIDPARKSALEAKAARLKKEYEDEIAKWKLDHPDEVAEYEASKNAPDTKSKKKKRREGMPKQPKTAYLLFCDGERERVKEERPDVRGKDIMGELAKRWKLIDPARKSSFEAEASRLHEEYKKDVTSWERDNPGESKAPKKARRPEGMPKQPLHAYQIFLQEQRSLIMKEVAHISLSLASGLSLSISDSLSLSISRILPYKTRTL